MTRTNRPSRPYDTEATKSHITDAAMRLLADRGFTALGINALASAAGVDKQLIYYHFGGLAGVVRALGSQLDLWLGAPLQARPGESYAEAAARLLCSYAEALRNNTLVLKLLAWELCEPSEALAELEQTRSLAMATWVDTWRRSVGNAPPGVDAPAINALLLAGLQHLALREHSVGSFAGLDLKDPQSRQRIAQAVCSLSASVYAQPPGAGQGIPSTTTDPS